jgi:hypothetical protein
MDQERIIPNTNRALQVSKTRRKLFGRARQQAFLERRHQRGLAGRTPDNRQRPTRVPIEALTEKLVRKIKALGVVVDEE